MTTKGADWTWQFGSINGATYVGLFSYIAIGY